MSIEAIIEEIIQTEGGYSDDPHDLGGKTKYGITELVAKQNGYTGHMRDLQKELAVQIYKNRYWLDLKFDQIANLCPTLAEELCDCAVNQGPSFAKETFQQALNLLNRNGQDYADVKEDGAIGAKTFVALVGLLHKRGSDAENLITKTVVILRGARYIAICKASPSQEVFLTGWLTNRVHFK